MKVKRYAVLILDWGTALGTFWLPARISRIIVCFYLGDTFFAIAMTYAVVERSLVSKLCEAVRQLVLTAVESAKVFEGKIKGAYNAMCLHVARKTCT